MPPTRHTAKSAAAVTSADPSGPSAGTRRTASKTARGSAGVRETIAKELKEGPEQQRVVGPAVEFLTSLRWQLEQIQFGRGEWRVPKRPSEATKREKGHEFEGFPCDIAIFDSPKRRGDATHVLILIEAKTPDETAGVAQLETYLGLEPHAKLGVWINNPDPSALAVFVHRLPDGRLERRTGVVADIPKPGDPVSAARRRLTFRDLIVPNADVIRRTFQELLDRIVVDDPIVTRTEDQLDQLCNLLLLKIASDKVASLRPDDEVYFRPRASAAQTGEAIRERFAELVDELPDTFSTERDRQLLLSDLSIAQCVDRLAPLNLYDAGATTISLGFQVLRKAALRAGEGQYFTPQPVIAGGLKLLEIDLEDRVIDPACGTGGFLVQVLLDMQRRYPGREKDISRWAQSNIHGIDKDAIAVKLTKAIMQLAGDGSAHCVRGDSVRTDLWPTTYPHLADRRFANGRFSVVVTNPPFGKGLKISANHARLAGLTIAQAAGGGTKYVDLEIGLIFLQRAHDLLRIGGRLGIVLPETYFFSPKYLWLFDWIEPRLRPVAVLDIPMEAFQGFCRAKTNFYVFEKIA